MEIIGYNTAMKKMSDCDRLFGRPRYSLRAAAATGNDFRKNKHYFIRRLETNEKCNEEAD